MSAAQQTCGTSSPASIRARDRNLDILLKIETVAAFDALPDILLELMKWADVGVMIARGDLAVEAGFERLAEVQEEILWLCEAAHVPVIWATQVLDTLARTGRPSRAEVTDAAMAQRAECVMLNKGPFINEAISMLADILGRMQDHTQKKRSLLRRLRAWDQTGAADGTESTLKRARRRHRSVMELTVLVLITAALFAWALVSARLQQADLTAPMVFIAVGAALAWSGLVDGSAPPEAVTPVVEITLVWVLFSDAARLPLQQLRRDVGRYVRLLGVGLPLTIVFGWVLAVWFFPHFGLWLALLVGAALAPTDAALGVPVVTNPVVPSRIRQLITVESGLNDGIATPVVMVAIAGAAAAAGLESAAAPGSAAVELLIGAGVGAAAGALGGWLLQLARRRGTAAEDFAGIGVLALSLLAYTAALAVGGNGFVAAFCGGLAFGTCAGQRAPAELVFVEQMGGLVVTARVAGLRSHRRSDHAGALRPPDHRVCRAQPHGGAHAAGGAGLDWCRPRPEHHPVRGVVRSARPGFPRVRTAGAGSPRTSVR